jgi:hypothetical protein
MVESLKADFNYHTTIDNSNLRGILIRITLEWMKTAGFFQLVG